MAFSLAQEHTHSLLVVGHFSTHRSWVFAYIVPGGVGRHRVLAVVIDTSDEECPRFVGLVSGFFGERLIPDRVTVAADSGHHLDSSACLISPLNHSADYSINAA